MSRHSPSAGSVCALSLGVIVSLCWPVSWRPSASAPVVRVGYPAASQQLVGAETRSARMVLDATTGSEEAVSVEEWLSRADVEKLREALAEIARHPSPALRLRWFAAAFHRWALLDFAGAWKQIESIDKGVLQLQAFDALVDTRDSDEAVWALFPQLSDPALQMRLLARYFQTAAKTTPLLCAERAVKLREPFIRQMAVTQVVNQWSAVALRDCVTWSRQVSDVQVRGIALAMLFERYAKSLDLEMIDIAAGERDLPLRRQLLSTALRHAAGKPVQQGVKKLLAMPLDLTWQGSLREFIRATRKQAGADVQHHKLGAALPAELRVELGSVF